ncbi:MAG: hypothetical protein R2880_14295 [Deinococcales bacterium]
MIDINLLPKTFRKRTEPSYWRLIAILVPLAIFLSILTWQIILNLEAQRLSNQKNELELTKRQMQRYLDEQAALERRRTALNELLRVRDEVKEGTITWSNELMLMLETLPPPVGDKPSVSFRELNIRALDPRAREQARATYEGLDVAAEMEVQGIALNTETLANYIHALQDSPIFGVSFQRASLDEETNSYDFTVVIGSAAEGKRE